MSREEPEAPPSALRQGVKLAAIWGLGALGAGALLVAGWRQLTAGEWMRIRAVSVSGTSRAIPAEIVALSPVKVGDHLLAADLESVERAVARHPWVESVTAHRRLPPAVDLHVVERQPAALVDLGGLYLVDRHGEVFKRAAAGDGLDLPVVTGLAREDYLQRRETVETQLRAALALLGEYDREGLAPTAPVSEVHLQSDGGLTLYVGEDGTQVRLGSGDLPQKLVRLHRVLEALRADGRRAEVIHLDDRNHPDRVAVRPAGSGAAHDVSGTRSEPSRVEGAREGPGRRRGRDAPLVRR